MNYEVALSYIKSFTDCNPSMKYTITEFNGQTLVILDWKTDSPVVAIFYRGSLVREYAIHPNSILTIHSAGAIIDHD